MNILANRSTDKRMTNLSKKAIDCHCHVYPEKIAERAVKAVGDFYGIHMDVKNGTADGLLDICDGSPIEKCIIHSVATKPEQVASINDFIAEECNMHPEFVGFMTLHQDMTDDELEAEIDRALHLGLKGIKLHPDTQMVNMDDPRLMRIYEIAEARQIPIIMHCGDYRYDYSHPRRLKNVLDSYPNLVIDAAHFGGWSLFDLAYEILKNENCYVDMSSSIEFLGLERTAELTRLYGTDRVMFGSDFPMWDPTSELEKFASIGFSESELEDLLYNNAERFISGKQPR